MSDEQRPDDEPTNELTNGERPEDAEDELHLLVALGAVDALDPEEQHRLDAALAARPDLVAEFAELRAAAGEFAEATVADPPPSLRSDVLAAIAAEAAQSAGIGTDGAEGADRPAGAPSPSSDTLATVTPLSSRRRWVYAAASAAAAAVLAVTAVAVLRDGGPSTPERIAAVVEHDAVEVLPLTGELDGLALHLVPGHSEAVIAGSDIPAPSGTDVYELWQIAAGTPRRVDIFRPDEAGGVTMLLSDLQPAAGVQYAITVEPAGGVDEPTTDPVAVAVYEPA